LLFEKVSGNDFLIRDLRSAYDELSFGKDVNAIGGAALDLIKSGRQEHFVSVRPSTVCTQPGCECSFSGHGKASLNLIGYKYILAGAKECWFSVFSPEALLYRKAHGIEQFSLAVIVQKMVDSELSGTLFTSEPVSGDRTQAMVEGLWGLGESLSAGAVCPDQFFIDKETGLGEKRISRKLWLRRRGPLSGNTIQERVPLSKVSMETLSERDFPRFASIAKKVEELLKTPQEMEWCVERGRIVLLQSKPIVFPKEKEYPSVSEGLEKIASGVGVSPGTAGGKTLIYPITEKPSVPGILVAKALGIELLPYAKWFSGIVSEQGGCGSCMASLGRELGIPIVTGVENATIILAGKEIVVDGKTGSVFMAQ
jgi:pyruvate,water dikinase